MGDGRAAAERVVALRGEGRGRCRVAARNGGAGPFPGCPAASSGDGALGEPLGRVGLGGVPACQWGFRGPAFRCERLAAAGASGPAGFPSRSAAEERTRVRAPVGCREGPPAATELPA